jgi:pimeloyl-ACP methyl ester carboxylesterase
MKDEKRDSSVDVFFIHPTTYTGRKTGVNADMNDAELNAKTDYSTILYQGSVFNQHARIFSPRYRQMHFSQFFVSQQESKPAFDTAYNDVKRAFDFYLRHYSNNRPIIIAGHSQGALMAERLLKEYFDGKPLQQKLVAAYLVGWPVARDYFSTLPVCATPEQTGCFCSWRTYREGYVPEYIQRETPQAVVTNPLRWDTTQVYAPREINTGAVLRDFNELVPAVADAQIHDGVLWISKPKFKGSFFFRTKNYHIADVNFYYNNIRSNVTQRIEKYMRMNEKK